MDKDEAEAKLREAAYSIREALRNINGVRLHFNGLSKNSDTAMGLLIPTTEGLAAIVATIADEIGNEVIDGDA